MFFIFVLQNGNHINEISFPKHFSYDFKIAILESLAIFFVKYFVFDKKGYICNILLQHLT